MKRSYSALATLLASLAAAIVGVWLVVAPLGGGATGVDARHEDEPGADLFIGVAPGSIDELLMTTPLVVIGSYGEPLRETCELPYDYLQIRHDVRPDDRPFLRIAATYYSFHVEEVVFSEPGIDVESGYVLTVRLAGHEVGGRLGFGTTPAPRPGDRQLLVAGMNPDGSYGPITPWHAFDVEGPTVLLSANRRPPAWQRAELAPAEFVDEIRSRLQQRGPSAVPLERYPDFADRVDIVSRGTDCWRLPAP